MSVIYHDGNRDLHDRFDTRRIADRIEEVLLADAISAQDAAFIESRDMFFLAMADDAGMPNCSYKGSPNCPRYIHRYTLVERSRFVPRKGKATVLGWKCADWSADALGANDPARDPGREVI